MLVQILIGWMVIGLVINTIETVWFKWVNPQYRPKSVVHFFHMLAWFLLMVPLWPFTIVSVLCDDDY